MKAPLGIRIVGEREALTRLNKQISSIVGLTQAGLIRGGLYIQRESQKIVPVRTGNLRSSAFTVWKDMGKVVLNVFNTRSTTGQRTSQVNAVTKAREIMTASTVLTGYSATYAIYVHEDSNATHNAGKVDHFLSRVLSDRKGIMNAILGVFK